MTLVGVQTRSPSRSHAVLVNQASESCGVRRFDRAAVARFGSRPSLRTPQGRVRANHPDGRAFISRLNLFACKTSRFGRS